MQQSLTETVKLNKKQKPDKKRFDFNKFLKDCKKQKYLILLCIPAFLVVLIFNYFPIYGILIAFKEYNPAEGIMGSKWVGLKYFEFFIKDPYSLIIVKNTLLLGLYSLLWSFPAPIILALLLNEIKNKYFKKIVQTISYFPNFISAVIIVGLLKQLAGDDGLFNIIRSFFGAPPVLFFAEKGWFRTLYIGSGIWQGLGWGSIIYLAALSGVDTELYEAAEIDGANRWHKAIHITIPAMLPTITILLILSTASIISIGFEKVMLMYNPSIYEVSDVISTYVYREGIEGARFSYTTAVGLIQSVVAFILIYFSNLVSRKVSETSLW